VHYLKIIRIPNLLIIILTQYLLRTCIIGTFYGINATSPSFGHFDFLLLVISTVLIAAGGYVINDYFDVRTDEINKPAKMIISKRISLKPALNFYRILSVAGVLIGFYLSYRVNYLMLGFIFPAIAMMLWFYSARYQRTILWGNLAISLLSAMVVLIVWLFEFFALRANPINYSESMKQLGFISLIVAAYAAFAFLVTLIREIMKDIEDIEGDRTEGFRTLPIVSGISVTKRVALIISVLTILLLGICQYYLYRTNLTLVFWYILAAVQTFLVYLVYSISRAKTKEDFHFVSLAAKIVMVAGILSMQLFYISY
jgi:4-hydroxybenzoate polyprenyltransferase